MPTRAPASRPTTSRSGRRSRTRCARKFEDAGHEIRIIGFAKQISDIAEGARSVVVFFALAFVLTALAVWWYCRSWAFTAAALVCSLVSLVWQFASLQLLGYGLDPLAILVPFLVFAIGVSHGVQQINTIVREIGAGSAPFDAARHSFGALLVPGTMALVTAFVGFATLMLIPIPMIRELAITASLGVAYKIVTNLIMLPVVASYVRLPADYGARMQSIRERRAMAVVGAGAAGRAAAGAFRRGRGGHAVRPGRLGQPRPPCRLRAARRAGAARQRALQPRRGGASPRSSRSGWTC